MDPEDEDDIQNEKNVSRLEEKLKEQTGKTAKKAADNVKGTFRKAWKKIPITVRAKIVFALVIIFFIAIGLFYFARFFGDNNVSGGALKDIKDEVIEITDKNEDGNYYYKISKDFVEKYKDALNKVYENGGYEVSLNRTFDNLDNLGSQIKPNSKNDKEATDETFNDDTIEEWFKTDNKDDIEAYLIKMIRTEIESSYPKLSDYEGKEFGILGNKKNKELGNKTDGTDYVAQGIIRITRTKMNVTEDGREIAAPTSNYNTAMNPNAISHSSGSGVSSYTEILPTGLDPSEVTGIVIYFPGDGEYSTASKNFSVRRSFRENKKCHYYY